MFFYYLIYFKFFIILSQKIIPKELISYEYFHFSLDNKNDYKIFSYNNKFTDGDLVFNIYKIKSDSYPKFYIYTDLTLIEKDNETQEFINYSIKDNINITEYEYIIKKSSPILSNNSFYIVIHIKNGEFIGDITIFNENDITIIEENNICRRYKTVYSNNLLVFKTNSLQTNNKIKISFDNQFRRALTTIFIIKKDGVQIVKEYKHIFFQEYELEKNSIYSFNIQSYYDPGNQIDFNICFDINLKNEEIQENKIINKGFISSTNFNFFSSIKKLTLGNYQSFIFSFDYYHISDLYRECNVNCFKDDLLSEKTSCDYIRDKTNINNYYIVFQKNDNFNFLYLNIICNQKTQNTDLNKFSLIKEKQPIEILDDYKSNFENPYIPIYFLLNINSFIKNNYQLLLFANVENSISLYNGNIQSHKDNIQKIDELSYSFILLTPEEIKKKYSETQYFSIKFFSENTELLYIEFKYIKNNYQKFYYEIFEERKKHNKMISFQFCYYETFLIYRYKNNDNINYLYNETSNTGEFKVLLKNNLENISSIDDILQGKSFNELIKIYELNSNLEIVKVICNSILDINNYVKLFYLYPQIEYENLKSGHFYRYYIENKKSISLIFDKKILDKEFGLEISILNSKVDNFKNLKIKCESQEYELNNNNLSIRIYHKNKLSATLNLEAYEGNALVSILISDVEEKFKINKHGLKQKLENNYNLFIYTNEEMNKTKSAFIKLYSQEETQFSFYQGFKKYPFIPFPSEDFLYNNLTIHSNIYLEFKLLKNSNSEDSFISIYSPNQILYYDFLFIKNYGLIFENLSYEFNYEGVVEYNINSDLNKIIQINKCGNNILLFSFIDENGIIIKKSSVDKILISELPSENITVQFNNSYGTIKYFNKIKSYIFDPNYNFSISYSIIDNDRLIIYFTNFLKNEDMIYDVLVSYDKDFDLNNICIFNKEISNYSYINLSIEYNGNNDTIYRYIKYDRQKVINNKLNLNILAKQKSNYKISTTYYSIEIEVNQSSKKIYIIIIICLILFLFIIIAILLIIKNKKQKQYLFDSDNKEITEKPYDNNNRIFTPYETLKEENNNAPPAPINNYNNFNPYPLLPEINNN